MTAYEIRLNLLNMAKELLTEDFYNQKNALESNWMTKVDCMRKNDSVTADQLPDYPTMPKFPTDQEIIAKAKALNDFISNG